MTRRGLAALLILVADAGFVAWGAMAAIALERLPGPGGVPILAAGYQGYTGEAWAALVAASPKTAAFIGVIFRLYGVFNVAVGLLAMAIAATAFRRGEVWAWWALLAGDTLAFGAAMTYDRTVRAIGPFELSEYLGLALVYAGLAITAPFLAPRRPAASAAG